MSGVRQTTSGARERMKSRVAGSTGTARSAAESVRCSARRDPGRAAARRTAAGTCAAARSRGLRAAA